MVLSMNDKLVFDEVDLNVIADALRCKIVSTKWKLDDESEWEALKHIKFLEQRIFADLNGSDS